MLDLTNSHSLTEFQRNAREFIDGLNERKEPLLLTVNGKIQAIVVDPVTYRDMEESLERERFMEALKVGLGDIDEGRTRTLEDVSADLKAKYGIPG